MVTVRVAAQRNRLFGSLTVHSTGFFRARGPIFEDSPVADGDSCSGDDDSMIADKDYSARDKDSPVADKDYSARDKDSPVADEDYSARDKDGGIIARDFCGCYDQNCAGFAHFCKK